MSGLEIVLIVLIKGLALTSGIVFVGIGITTVIFWFLNLMTVKERVVERNNIIVVIRDDILFTLAIIAFNIILIKAISSSFQVAFCPVFK